MLIKKTQIKNDSTHENGSQIYQLDFVTPGISPLNPNILKQIRHIENFRRKPRPRPQIRQRL